MGIVQRRAGAAFHLLRGPGLPGISAPDCSEDGLPSLGEERAFAPGHERGTIALVLASRMIDRIAYRTVFNASRESRRSGIA